MRGKTVKDSGKSEEISQCFMMIRYDTNAQGRMAIKIWLSGMKWTRKEDWDTETRIQKPREDMEQLGRTWKGNLPDMSIRNR